MLRIMLLFALLLTMQGCHNFDDPAPQNALPEGYVDTWDLSASDKLADQDGYFLILHGTDYAVNNFGGNGDLAF